MSTTASYHFSIAILDWRIQLTDHEQVRTPRSISLAIGLLIVSLFVLLMPGEAAVLHLACGAAILSCSFVVLSHGAQRSIRLVTGNPPPAPVDRLGNLALIYAFLLCLTIAVICVGMARTVLG